MREISWLASMFSELPAGTTIVADGDGKFRVNAKYHSFQVPEDKRSNPTYRGNIQDALEQYLHYEPKK